MERETTSSRRVFAEPVGVEIELDRRLRRGDTLIVEPRDTIRDGEIIVAEGLGGAAVGRFRAGAEEVVLYPLAPGAAPARVRSDALHVRGVVIGVKTSL